MTKKRRRRSRSKHKSGLPAGLFVGIGAILFLLLMALAYGAFNFSIASGNSYSTPIPTLSPIPIITPAPISPPAPSQNLLSVVDGQWFTDAPTWAKAPAFNVVLDTADTYQGWPSWEVIGAGGVDHGLDISPGDHIVFSCWIKTSGASLSADYSNPQAGGRIGIDFYGGLGGISASSVPDGTTCTASNPYGSATDSFNTYVPFGVSGHDWTQVTMDFVVPSQIQYLYGIIGQTGQYSTGQMVVPSAVVVWLQVWSDTQGSNEHGTVWFADPVFTIT